MLGHHLTDEWIDKVWSICTMEYCSVMKHNEALKHTMMWTNVKKHYAKGKKLVTQDHVLCDCIYMKC